MYTLPEASAVVADLYEQVPELYLKGSYENRAGSMCAVQAVVSLTNGSRFAVRSFLKPYAAKVLKGRKWANLGPKDDEAAEAANNIDGIAGAIKMLRLAAKAAV